MSKVVGIDLGTTNSLVAYGVPMLRMKIPFCSSVSSVSSVVESFVA